MFAINIFPYYWYEVIRHYNTEKGKEIGAYQGIDHDPLVPRSDTLTASPRVLIIMDSK